MNRIQRALASQSVDSPAPMTPHSRFDATKSFATEGAPHYSLFRPMHYEANYAYPLVVYLHGPQGSQRQLDDFMPALSMRNYAGVAPQGVSSHAVSGYCWGQSTTDCQVEAAYDRVMACVDLAKAQLNIHASRVFLVGYADGGTMAMRVAMKSPAAFAGVASLCGAFPVGNAPLSNLKACRQLPIWMAAGRDSKSYTSDQACDELRLFHAAGMSVSLRQYPGGDDLDTLMLRDMNAWLMELVTGTPAITCEADESWGQSRSEESN